VQTAVDHQPYCSQSIFVKMSHDCHGDEEEENVEKSPEEIQLEATIAKHVGFVQEGVEQFL